MYSIIAIAALFCAMSAFPLTASQDTSAQKFLQLSANASANDSFNIAVLRTLILEQLTYHDYFLSIKPLSKSWKRTIEQDLANQQTNRPLVLPESDKLLAYMKYLLTNAKDSASVIQPLAAVCLRSWQPAETAFNAAIHLYTQKAPAKVRIFSFNQTGNLNFNPHFQALHKNWDDIATKIDRLTKLQKSVAPADIAKLTEDQKANLKAMQPFLEQWQPYGIFFKLADLYRSQGFINIPSNLKTTLRSFANGSQLNLKQAPELCATHPLIQPNNVEFVSSNHCYDQLMIDTYQHKIWRSKNQCPPGTVTPKRSMDLASLKEKCREFTINCAKKACVIWTEKKIKDATAEKVCLIHAMKMVFALDKIPASACPFAAKLLGNALSEYANHPVLMAQYLCKAIACWEATHNKAGADYLNAAICCDRVIDATNDEDTKKIYSRKGISFWDKYHQTDTNWSTKTGYMAAAAHTRATRFCSNICEKNSYWFRAIQLRSKCIMEELHDAIPETRFGHTLENDNKLQTCLESLEAQSIKDRTHTKTASIYCTLAWLASDVETAVKHIKACKDFLKRAQANINMTYNDYLKCLPADTSMYSYFLWKNAYRPAITHHNVALAEWALQEMAACEERLLPLMGIYAIKECQDLIIWYRFYATHEVYKGMKQKFLSHANELETLLGKLKEYAHTQPSLDM